MTRKPIAERFWPKVDKRGPDECWPWIGSFLRGGYGQLNRGGAGSSMTTAHRVAYEIAFGPVADGLVIDHLCRNRACVNPAHLEAVPQRINLLRGETVTAKAAAATHCPRGHAYDSDNTHITPRGERRCRECGRFRQSGYAERRHAYVPKPRSRKITM